MTLEEFDLLIQPDVKEVISRNLDEDPETFALRNSKKKDFPYRAISEQIYCTKKAKIKLPRLSEFKLLYEKTAIEQCSSESTAEFKSGLIYGSRIIDLTGGLGIDSTYFSRKFTETVYCETNQVLANIFRHNIERMNISNVTVKTGNGINWLESYPDNYFDWIYIDPSRRQNDRRTVGLQNCTPNVLEHMELFNRKSKNILIKASPAIEIEEVKKQINHIKNIYVVSVDNECKEVLIIISGNPDKDISLSSVMIKSGNGNRQIITGKINNKCKRRISGRVLKYFYDPDSSIIKARLTGRISDLYNLFFLNSTIDYLTSDNYITNFPGRAFEVKDFIVYNKNKFKDFLLKNQIDNANIARRDFPDSPELLKKKYSLKDGGYNYLFFTKDHSGKFIAVLCTKPATK